MSNRIKRSTPRTRHYHFIGASVNQMEYSTTPISVAIITKNEEDKLPECLASVSFAEDIVVVDSGSTDQTVAIAKKIGARVFIEPWQGFSYQKQFAVDQSKHDWVLILDADERIPPETARKLTQIANKPDSTLCGYSFRRKNYFHGRWIKNCGWWPNRILRFINRAHGSFDGKEIHESWVTNGPVKALDYDINHLSFRNYSELITKLEYYTTVSARELFTRKKQTNPFVPVSRGLWMFLKVYFLKQGFRDGFDGFMISFMHGTGSFIKHAKHLEMSLYEHFTEKEELRK